MRMKWMLTALIALGMAVPMSAIAQQQVDVGVSGLEAINSSSTSGNGTLEKATNGAGGAIEVRYLMAPFVGIEVGYAASPTTFTFSPAGPAYPLTYNEPTTVLSIKDNNVFIDYVASAKLGKLRPFGVAGLGFNITAAPASTYGVREVIRAAYNVGGGLDYGLTSHFGIRVQVRDFLVKAPNNSSLYPATGVTTQSVEPMGGVYYRF